MQTLIRVAAAPVALVGAFLLGAVLLLPGCEDKAAPTSSAAVAQAPAAGSKVSILKITVRADGKLLANGAALNLSELDAQLGQLAADKGEVWYYRENPTGEPPPIATGVMDLIIKHGVPISMSTKADYSDTVDAEGTTHPRK